MCPYFWSRDQKWFIYLFKDQNLKIKEPITNVFFGAEKDKEIRSGFPIQCITE